MYQETIEEQAVDISFDATIIDSISEIPQAQVLAASDMLERAMGSLDVLDPDGAMKRWYLDEWIMTYLIYAACPTLPC